MGEEVGLAVLDGAGQLRQGTSGYRTCAQRDGVDEQTGHVGDTGHLGGTARHGDAEDHVVLPGQLAQRGGPGGLHQGVDGDAELACGLRQARGGRGLQGALQPYGLLGTALRRAHQGRPGTDERLAPRGGGALVVLRGQPGEVVAVRAGRGAQVQAGVGAQGLAEQDRHGPAVDDEVVAGHHEPPAVVEP